MVVRPSAATQTGGDGGGQGASWTGPSPVASPHGPAGLGMSPVDPNGGRAAPAQGEGIGDDLLAWRIRFRSVRDLADLQQTQQDARRALTKEQLEAIDVDWQAAALRVMGQLGASLARTPELRPFARDAFARGPDPLAAGEPSLGGTHGAQTAASPAARPLVPMASTP